MSFSRALVHSYKQHLLESKAGVSSINLSLAAIRLLAKEGAANGLLDEQVAASIRSIHGVAQSGTRAGNWLTLDQGMELLCAPDQCTARGRRDFLLLGLLVGCGLRREEACSLTTAHVQWRDGRLLLVDITGKGRRIRTVPIPQMMWDTLGTWMREIGDGPLLRALTTHGTVTENPISGTTAYDVVLYYARKLGIEVAPHDLRRTFAKLALRGGSKIEQIQITLGHSSVQTTERYLGVELDLENPVCEKLGL